MCDDYDFYWDDEEEDEDDWFVEYGIDPYFENKALKLFKEGNEKELEKLIDELSKKYSESYYIHIIALYKTLLDKENSKELILTILKLFQEEKLEVGNKIVILLVDILTEFYNDKADLEKIYTFVLKVAYKIVRVREIYDLENIDEIVDIIIKAGEWLKGNLELEKKYETIIDYVILKCLDNILLDDKNKEEIEHFFRIYIRYCWNLRNFLNIEQIFKPLVCGIGWSFVKLTSKSDEEIINYFINLGVEENIARELFELYKDYEEN
jgi:hypothetical protein